LISLLRHRQCKIEDMDSQGQIVPPGRSGQGAPSVLLKVSHKDPSKPAVKKHHSIVLRSESPAEKYSWLRRLKLCSEGPGAMRNLPPRPTLASTQDGGGAASKAPRRGGGELAPAGPESGYGGVRVLLALTPPPYLIAP